MNSQDSLLQFIRISPFACMVVDRDLTITALNAPMRDILCFSSEELASQISLLDFISSDEQAAFLNFFGSLKKPAKSPVWETYKLVDNQGITKRLLVNGYRTRDGNPEREISIFFWLPLFEESIMDAVSSHVGQKLVTEDYFNKFKTIFESATVGITIFDEKGIIEETNQAFADYLSLPKEEVLHRHYTDLFKGRTKDEFESMIETVGETNAGHVRNVITLEDESGTYRILEISLAKVLNPYESLNMLMLITKDITDEQKTHTALLQSEKLALTGRLAASLAHEINNPLQTSIGCLGLAEEMLGEDDQDLEVYIKMAIDELKRSARIVKKLRDLNRVIDPVEKQRVNLYELLDGVFLLTKNRLFDRNIVPVYPYEGQAHVLASKDQIQQVILNLVMNAIDAMPEGGNIYVDVLKTEDPFGYTLKVRDTGAGMDRDVLDKLFDPFFTTKEDGLGLGLYICKEIIEKHSGRVEVSSQPGEGTEFSVWLPGSPPSQEEETL